MDAPVRPPLPAMLVTPAPSAHSSSDLRNLHMDKTDVKARHDGKSPWKWSRPAASLERSAEGAISKVLPALNLLASGEAPLPPTSAIRFAHVLAPKGQPWNCDCTSGP